MPALILYLLKVGIAYTAFYTLYYFLFRKEKQFQFNRFYLLFIFITGLLFPVIVLKLPAQPVLLSHLPNPRTVAGNGAIIGVTSNHHDITAIMETIFLYSYFIFGIFLMLRLLYGYLSVYRIISKGSRLILENQEVIVTEKNITPFSFFNKIIIPESLVSSPDLLPILEHEKVHIRERHSIDILMAELAYTFQWFNPIALLLKKAVRLNLEYMADYNAISKYPDIENYQMAMVRLADNKPLTVLVNTFYTSQLKNRIIMMKNNNPNRYPILKKSSIFPMALLMILLISQKKYIVPPTQDDGIIIKGKVISSEDQKPLPRVVVYLKSNEYGVFTDLNGDFSLKSEKTENITLVLSAVGYERKEVNVLKDQPVIISLNHEGSNKYITTPDSGISSKTVYYNNLKGNVNKKNTEPNNVIKIKGRISSSNNHSPLPSMNVFIMGKTIGTISDENGNYVLEVDKEDKAIIIADPIGQYKRQEIDLDKIINVNINLNAPLEVNVELNPKK